MITKNVVVKEPGTDVDVEFSYPALDSLSKYLPKGSTLAGDALVSTIEEIVGCVESVFGCVCDAPYNLYAAINRKGTYKVMSNETCIRDGAC